MQSLVLNIEKKPKQIVRSLLEKFKPEKVDPITEARRYVDNAHEVLRERGKFDPETKCYQDKKYVRAAGNYLWHAVIIAFDAVFQVSASSKRVDINDFRQAVTNRDKKLLTALNSAYEVIHLYMSYDGNLRKGISDEGFELANDIIDRCAKLYK